MSYEIVVADFVVFVKGDFLFWGVFFCQMGRKKLSYDP